MQDIVLKSRLYISPETADDEIFEKLRHLASEYHAEDYNGERLRIHLVLHNASIVSSLRSNTLSSELFQDVEVYAYTQADIAAMHVLGVLGDTGCRLDRNAITYLSDVNIHLVIFGSSPHAESLAIFTSLLCHFPNYCRDENLRTRITWISDSISDFTAFRQKYKGLLDQCFVRVMMETENGMECKTMTCPAYHGKRKDFVDIEWEFVESTSGNDAVAYKLEKWSESESQELTIAFCYNDENRNIDCALTLPRHVYDLSQIYVKTKSRNAIELLKGTDKFCNVYAFGTEDEQSVDFGNLIRMAQCVNYAYCNMKEGNTPDNISMMVPLEIPDKDVLQKLWNNPKLTIPKRWSNIYNAITLRPKMRAIGLHPEEWKDLISLPESDIDKLAEVEHNRWCVEELILGYIPTTDDEHQRILNDISERGKLKNAFVHDDLRNFNELGVDESGLSVVRYDYGVTKCLPLIAYTYYHTEGGIHE